MPRSGRPLCVPAGSIVAHTSLALLATSEPQLQSSLVVEHHRPRLDASNRFAVNARRISKINLSHQIWNIDLRPGRAYERIAALRSCLHSAGSGIMEPYQDPEMPGPTLSLTDSWNTLGLFSALAVSFI